jgi:large subunit ribosomal protein L2
MRYSYSQAGIKPGDIILTSETAPVVPGNTLPLYRLPLGTFVHSIELKPGKGAQLCRAGGAAAQVMKQAGKHTIIKFKSGEIRRVCVWLITG